MKKNILRKKIKLNLILIVFLTVIILIILTEIILRITVGFGNPLLYITDEKIGYLIAPNQRTKRNGNLIEINSYSMRTKPINKERNKDTLRVLIIGDSIVNGGWWTDQNKTISALLEKSLKDNNNQYSDVEVLNISANSWNPRNELAYLQKFGTFDSQIIILIINTDDFFGLKPSSLVVGNDFNYPNKKPLFAWQELGQKIIKNKFKKVNDSSINVEKDLLTKNLNAIKEIKLISDKKKAQFILALTPLKREITPPYSRDYEEKARIKLQDLTQTQKINYIDFLTLFKQEKNSTNFYYDHIHLNQLGTEFISKTLCKQITD